VVPGEHSDWPEQARKHLPEALDDGWLVFESAGEKRRLHPIPPGWDAESDEQLWRHCLLAQPVRRRPVQAEPPVLEVPL
jgi:hypothetical protein